MRWARWRPSSFGPPGARSSSGTSRWGGTATARS
uniref:Uncharacterized protein n=1 Tax=Arundo donax TaxID=35708 RepID=A0A0A9FED1_ARUDO